jgi:thiamine-monophosphate kinase
MGLQLLERERIVFEHQVDEARRTGNRQELAQLEQAQPDWAGHEYILEKQLKPEARRDVILALAEAGLRPTSMMDISDGLSSELLHICTQSHVGCCIYEERIPLDYQTATMAEELNMNVTTCALNGGEDYELLFTCSLEDYEKLIPVDDLYIIGHITKPEYGCNLIGRNGEELPLKAQGWNAFNG